MTGGLKPAGVPSWLAANLNFCSRCGAGLSYGPLPEETRDRLACDSCGFIAYVNPRLVVSTVTTERRECAEDRPQVACG